METIIEIGNSHEGSLGIAASFVDMAKTTGAKVVKFQMHLANFEGTSEEPFRADFSMQDNNRQDYWRRVNFTEEEWIKLANYVESSQMEFLCTPFSKRAACFLFDRKLVKRWKVGSGDAANFPLLDYLASTGLPIIISTGLVSWSEILKIKEFLTKRRAWSRTTLMHCVSKYPVPLEEVSLNLIEELRSLECAVGYSDHSGNIAVALKAIALGIDLLEVHMTPHRLFFGPDTSSSLTPDEIREILNISEHWQILEKKYNPKSALYEASERTRSIFRKGIYWAESLESGTVITLDHLQFLKPCLDVDSIHYEDIIGRRVLQSVIRGRPLRLEELD